MKGKSCHDCESWHDLQKAKVHCTMASKPSNNYLITFNPDYAIEIGCLPRQVGKT